MGASVSSNVSDITNSVKNTINNTTKINTAQASSINNVIGIHCAINTKNLKIQNIVEENLRNVQISDVSNSNSLQNNIAQSSQQAAKSTVGSLGIGYAASSNAVSMSSNVSNAVTNALKQNNQQISRSSNYFNCSRDAQIDAQNVEITNSNKIKMVQKTILKNQSVTDLKNTLTQSVKQTATSTVEGATAALLAIAAIIVAIGWSFGKVVTSGAAYVKPLISVIVLVIVCAVIYLSWYNNWAPFFNVIPQCLMKGPYGENDPYILKNGKCDSCVQGKQNSTMNMPNCTPRYTYPLFSSNDNYASLVGIKAMPGNSASVLGMAQVPPTSMIKDEESKFILNNGGFNGATYNRIYQKEGAHSKFFSSLLASYNSKNDIFGSNKIIKTIIIIVLSDVASEFTNASSMDFSKVKKDAQALPGGGGGGVFPKIISIPVSKKGNCYNIPSQYLVGGGQEDDDNYGICTPGYFIYNPSGQATDGENAPPWPASFNTIKNKPEGCLVPGSWPGWNVKDISESKTPLAKVSSQSQSENALLMANDNSNTFKRYFYDPSSTSKTIVDRVIMALPDENQSIIKDAVFGFVRFYLLNLTAYLSGGDVAGLGLNTYINDYELVNPPGGIATEYMIIELGNTKDYFKYSPSTTQSLLQSFNNQGGTLEGYIGLCNFKDLKLHNDIKKYGTYGVVVLVVGFLLMIWRAGGKSQNITRGGASLLEQRGRASK